MKIWRRKMCPLAIWGGGRGKLAKATIGRHFTDYHKITKDGNFGNKLGKIKEIGNGGGFGHN